MPDNGSEVIQKEIFDDVEEVSGAFGGSPFIAYLAAAGDVIPGWWSQERDQELRKFWKNSDHLAGTVNTLREMMVAMPFEVVAKDNSIKSHTKQAQEFTEILNGRTESRSNLVDQGWDVGYGPFIEDIYTQDNGGWMVIDGPGRGDEPLKGMPTKLIHLDSLQCWRTQNPEHPLVYTDLDGQQYKLHKSRVINITSQSAPIQSMFGVGFCAVSRCINIAQSLTDIYRYKQEKLGSRPHRGLLAIQDSGGSEREAKAVSLALQQTDESLDNMGFTRYSKVPVVSIKGTLSLIDFASLPDGFDELNSVQLGMTVLALAFGVDVRQLAFAIGVAGQTKADAEVQHLKMRGKGPGYILSSITRRLNHKFLPPYLRIQFDYQDDEQDALNAEIRKLRGERREKDLATGTTSIRVEREIMMEEGEITEAQFIQLELDDGRLPDGEDALALFQSPDFMDVLPDINATPEEIEESIRLMQQVLMSNARSGIKSQASMALAALEKLRERPQPEIDNEPDDSEMDEEKAKSIERDDLSMAQTIKSLFTKQEKPEVVVNMPPIELPEIIVNVPKQPPPFITVQVPETEMEIERDDSGLMKKVTKRRVDGK